MRCEQGLFAVVSSTRGEISLVWIVLANFVQDLGRWCPRVFCGEEHGNSWCSSVAYALFERMWW